MKGDFKKKVLEVVRAIPQGQTRNYKEVAIAAGSPLASRTVGNVLRDNKDPEVPSHRVIKASGKLGQYTLGTEAKRNLLVAEGAL